MTTLSLRGKSRTQCERCKRTVMRVVWVTDATTQRKLRCEWCDHEQPMGKMDRRVYTMMAPEDAEYLRHMLGTAQSAVLRNIDGDAHATRWSLSEFQLLLNRMPAHLRNKLELP
jgi:hypothetical protein